jgi:hypothetical protein
VAEEVEVHPLRGGAAFRATQDAAVKSAGGGEIFDGKGEVKRLQTHGMTCSIEEAVCYIGRRAPGTRPAMSQPEAAVYTVPSCGVRLAFP